MLVSLEGCYCKYYVLQMRTVVQHLCAHALVIKHALRRFCAVHSGDCDSLPNSTRPPSSSSRHRQANKSQSLGITWEVSWTWAKNHWKHLKTHLCPSFCRDRSALPLNARCWCQLTQRQETDFLRWLQPFPMEMCSSCPCEIFWASVPTQMSYSENSDSVLARQLWHQSTALF